MLHFWALLYLVVTYVRPGEIVPALAEVPLIDYLSIGGAAIALVSLLLNPRKFWDQPQDKLFLLFTAAIVVSNPLNGYFGGATESLNTFGPVLFCYFLLRMGVTTTPQMKRFARVFIWLNLFLATNGLLQVYTGAGFGNLEAMDYQGEIRIMGTGIFNDPNDLGMTLVMSFPFVLSALTQREHRFVTKLLALVGLVVLLMACYYTNSRGTMLGLGVLFTVYTYRRYGAVTAGVLGTVAVAVLMVAGPSRMSEISADEDSAQGRIQAWSEGYEMFQSSPLWGIGYRLYGEQSGLVAHNSFVHVMGELGLMGIIPFVGMFYAFFQTFKKKPGPVLALAGPEARLARDLPDSGIGMLTCMTFLSRQYVAVPFILLAVSASHRATLSPSEAEVDTNKLLYDAATIVALTFGLMVFFYLMVKLFVVF